MDLYSSVSRAADFRTASGIEAATMALFSATRNGDLIGVLKILRRPTASRLFHRRFLVQNGDQGGQPRQSQQQDLLLPPSSSPQKGSLPSLRLPPAVFVPSANVRLFPNGATPLLAAIAYGHLDIAAALIRKGRADVNARNGHGETALLMALRAHSEAQNRLEMPIDNDDDGWSGCLGVDLRFIRLLIDSGADVNAADNNGFTPLHAACHDDVMFDLMLANSANIHAQTRLGVTPLFRVSSEHMARVLLERGADPNHQDHRGDTPLFYIYRPAIVNYEAPLPTPPAAVDADDADAETDDHSYFMVRIFKTLIAGGANVNHRNTMGRTALHTHCARLPSRDGIISAIIISTLLMAGADCTCTCVGVCGRSPLSFLSDVMVDHLLDELGRIDRSATRREALVGPTAPPSAIPSFAFLMNHKRRMNEAAVCANDSTAASCHHCHDDDDGAEALSSSSPSSSSRYSVAATARALAEYIRSRRDENNEEFHRNLHLFDAIEANEQAPIDEFIKKGGDVDTRDPYGCTLLSCAVQCGRAEITRRLLVGENANVNAENYYRQSIVMTAATAGRADMIQLLADCGADVSNAKPNFHGEGPLACATSGPAVAALLSLGIDLTAKNARGNTALGNAWCDVLTDSNVRGGAPAPTTQTRLARLNALLAAGADVNERNCRHQTPLLRYLDRLGFEATKIHAEDEDDVDGEKEEDDEHAGDRFYFLSKAARKADAKNKKRLFEHPDAALIAALLDHGADIDVWDEYGRTPLAIFEERHGWEWDWAPGDDDEGGRRTDHADEEEKYVVWRLLGGKWPRSDEEMLGLLIGDEC